MPKLKALLLAGSFLALAPWAWAQSAGPSTTIGGVGGAWTCGTGMACTGHTMTATGSGSGGVSSVTCGTGLSGGTITTSGTCALTSPGVTPGTYQGITFDGTGRASAAAPGDVNIGLGAALMYQQNDNVTGTTSNRLVRVNSAGNAVIVSHTAVLGNAIGICVAGCGTSGYATIAWGGNVNCDFDGPTTAGHTVVPSTITDGKCRDTGGTSNPTNGDDIGVVQSTNAGAGTYSLQMTLLGVGASAKQAATLPGGTTGQFQVNGGSSFSGVTFSGDMAVAGAGVTTVSKLGGVSVSLGGALTTIGTHNLSLTTTADTTLTLPTSGTLATQAWVSEQGYGFGNGSVTTVGLSLPASLFTLSGTPVTSAGTLTGYLATQNANTFFAGPTSGSADTPAWRQIASADLPLPGNTSRGAILANAGSAGQFVKGVNTTTGALVYGVPAGGGNVVGPSSSTAGHVATFADASGGLLQDGGALPAGTVTVTGSTPSAYDVALFSGATSVASGGALGTACAINTGVSGATIPLLNGANTWSGTQTFGTTISSINTQSGTTYTLAATDCGKTLLFTSASAVTLTTLNSLPAGCYLNIEQGGAGAVTVSSGSGATLHSAHSYTKTFARYSLIGLFVDTNSGGTSADYILYGDGQ